MIKINQIENYFSVFFYIFSRVWKIYKKDSLFIIFISIIGIIGQSGSIFLLILVVRAFSEGEPVIIFDAEFRFGSDDPVFILIVLSVAVGFMLISGAVLQYRGSVAIANVARRYDSGMTTEIFARLLPMLGRVGATNFMDNVDDLKKAISIGSASSGQLVRRLLQGGVEVVFLIVYTSILIFIAPEAFVLILFLAPILLYLQYKTNVSGATAASHLQLYMPLARRATMARLDGHLKSATSIDRENDDVSLECMNRQRALDALEKRMVIPFRSKVITSFFSALAIFSIIILNLNISGATEKSLLNIIIVIIILRQQMSHLNSSLSIFSSMNLYYPSAAQCHRQLFSIIEFSEKFSGGGKTHNVDPKLARDCLAGLLSETDKQEKLNESQPIRLLYIRGQESLAIQALAEAMQLPFGLPIYEGEEDRLGAHLRVWREDIEGFRAEKFDPSWSKNVAFGKASDGEVVIDVQLAEITLKRLEVYKFDDKTNLFGYANGEILAFDDFKSAGLSKPAEKKEAQPARPADDDNDFLM